MIPKMKSGQAYILGNIQDLDTQGNEIYILKAILQAYFNGDQQVVFSFKEAQLPSSHGVFSDTTSESAYNMYVCNYFDKLSWELQDHSEKML